MASSSAGFHEDAAQLRPSTRDRHRATVSLMEELEAVDWYDQRIDTADDDELREVLRHNRDEEKEHAAMTLEWLRRHDPQLDHFLRAYLFTDLPITHVEAALESSLAEPGAATEPTGDLGIAGLRGRKESL